MKKTWSILLTAALLVLALAGTGCGSQTTQTAVSSASAVSAEASVSGTSSDTDDSTTMSELSAAAVSHDSETTESPVPSAPESADTSAPAYLESNTLQPSVIEFSLDNNRPFDTIEEYLQTDAAKAMVKQLNETESSSREVIRTAVFAEGGTHLVFERQLSTDFNLWLTDEFLENVKQSVEAQQETFVGLVDSLESCINSKSLLVVVRYVDPEGNVLYEREFDNDRLNHPSSAEGSDSSETASAEPSVPSAATSAGTA